MRDVRALAFQHQHQHRCVATNAVGRAAKQLLHVSNDATGRRLNNDFTSAVASRAPHCQFERGLPFICTTSEWGGGAHRGVCNTERSDGME